MDLTESASDPAHLALFCGGFGITTMKTAKQWVDENSQSGAFDTVGSCKDAEALVEAIQKDVLKSFIQTPKMELEVICETVARFTEIRQRGCSNLSVENSALDLLFTMLTTVRAASIHTPNTNVCRPEGEKNL